MEPEHMDQFWAIRDRVRDWGDWLHEKASGARLLGMSELAGEMEAGSAGLHELAAGITDCVALAVHHEVQASTQALHEVAEAALASCGVLDVEPEAAEAGEETG